MPIPAADRAALRRSAACLACTLAAALLAGCQLRGNDRPLSSELAPPPRLAVPPERCQSGAARFALGRTITAPLLEEMRSRAGALMARTVRTTDAPLADDPRRLLVDIEPSGRVVGLRCG